jgi:hypothetical protein
LKAKKISAMLLVAILAVACEKSDKKNELSSVEEYPGWRTNCPEGIGDAEWAHGACFHDIDGTYEKRYITSIYALLTNLKLFDNKVVVTCGYLGGDMTTESGSIVWSLYPTKEDFLHGQFTNGLAIDTLYQGELFRHMEPPYRMHACIMGNFSLAYRSAILRSGFTFAEIFSRYNE